ncbi:IPT/TIG domain-containing protein [Streptomyces spirodelae]|uniref:IPT/TIG domain-containing protein n=1 Tax=Streptomyces spirodelae TaxID=2812904 RepID=A0ABS3WQ44_9ACTN|nr:IPT/TIG domain-containing protein [Streptomyces spirodelae]MBO8185236.1 IPT/TIG domain-containing protein [Streptomyces spirodelae]
MSKAGVPAVAGATAQAVEVAGPFAVLTLPVGSKPDGVAVGPFGLRVHVANNGSGTVSVIDSGTHTLTTSFGPVNSPIGVQVTPDNTHVYVANSASDSVSVINRDSFSVVREIRVGKNPFTLRVSPGGVRGYVTNRGSDTVSMIDTTTNAVIATIPVGRGPTGVVVAPDALEVYAANNAGNSLSVIDTSTATVTATIDGLSAPVGVTISPDGRRLYVTNRGSDTVSVIDTGTRQITGTIPVGSGPRGVSISPDGRLVYVANSASDTVSIIDTDTLTVTATIPVGHQPSAVAITPNGLSAYVTNSGADTVSIIQTLNAMGPNRGPMTGGTLVTITGTNLGSAQMIRFNETPATILANTSNQILVASPPGSGTAQVTVTTVGGTSNPKPFFYYPNGFVDAIDPDAGPVAGRNSITIRGESLGTASRVYFGTVPAIPTVVSDSALSVSVPPSSTGAGVVPVAVWTAGGLADGERAYTYVVPPVLSGLTRTSGPVFGGNTIAVTGSYLATTQHVSVGGVTARFSIGSDTTAAVVIPAGARPGPVDVTVITAGGTATLSGAYTYI